MNRPRARRLAPKLRALVGIEFPGSLQIKIEDSLGRQAVQQGAETIFKFGDTEFNSKEHHGEPHYRAVMVRAGFDAANLGVKEPFEKGLTWAGLKRKPL